MPLNSAQIRHLRGLAHHLKPVVMLGNQGVTDAVVAALEEALEQHELLKLKTAGEDRTARDTLVADLLARTQAELVQRIGHIAVLYRRAKEPQIDLPGLPKIVRKEDRASPRGEARPSPYGRASGQAQAPARRGAKAAESGDRRYAGTRAERKPASARGFGKAEAKTERGYGKAAAKGKAPAKAAGKRKPTDKPTRVFGRAARALSGGRRGANRPG